MGNIHFRRACYATTLAVILFASASFAAGQMPSREFPLELPRGAKFHAEYRKAHLQFCLRELQEYDKFTSDPQAARAAAKKFLRCAISHFSEQLESEDPDAARWRELAEMGTAAVRGGSNDPLVHMHLVDALLTAGKTELAHKAMVAMLTTFEASKYPRGMRMLVVLRTKLVCDRLGDPQAIDGAQMMLHDATAGWFNYALESPETQRHAWAIYAQALGNVLPEAGAKAISAYLADAKHDDWLAEMQQGRFHSDLAWKTRGDLPSHELKLESWQRYVDEMHKSAEHYRRAYELQPSRPEAATAMIAVAQQGHDNDSTWDWFHRAIAAEADHMPAYEAALKSLRVRWGGSTREMFDFGEACVRTGRYDTDIPSAFILAAHAAHTETGDWSKVFAEPRLYDKLAFVVTRLVDHPSRAGVDELSFVQADLLSQNLCFAVSADNFADASRLWDRLGERASPEWLSMFALSEGYSRSRIAAYAAHGEKLLALRPLTIPPRTDPANARKLLAGYQALQKANRDRKADLYFQKWVELAQMEVDYHNGKWVDLTFDEALNQWIGDTRPWKREDEYSAVGSNVTTGDALWLYHQGEFPGPKEMTGEVEIVRSLSPGLMLGFYVGMLHNRDAGGRLFGIDPSHGHVAVGTPLTPIEAATLDFKPRVLHVKAWGPEHFAFYVDGRLYRSATNDPKFHMQQNCVGIGTLWWARMAGEIRFKNLRVRKLAEPPPPSVLEFEKRIAYYTDAIKREPQLTDHLFDRALAHYYLDHHAQAIADFEAALGKTPDQHQMRVYLGECYGNVGRGKEALEQLELALNKTRGPLDHAQRMMAYLLASLPESAQRDGARALDLANLAVDAEQQGDGVGLMYLACAQAESGRYEEALKSLAVAENLPLESKHKRQLSGLRTAFQQNKPHRLSAAEKK